MKWPSFGDFVTSVLKGIGLFILDWIDRRQRRFDDQELGARKAAEKTHEVIDDIARDVESEGDRDRGDALDVARRLRDAAKRVRASDHKP